MLITHFYLSVASVWICLISSGSGQIATAEVIDKQFISQLESRISRLTEDVARLEKLIKVNRHLSHNHLRKHKHREQCCCPSCQIQPQPPALSSEEEETKSVPSGRRHVRFLRGARQLVSAGGEPGPPGLDGVPGMDGAPGLDGVPGADGRNGRDGADGRDGQPGQDGMAGERGPQGPPGPAGEPGKRGKQGPPGKVGPPGAPGTCAYRATVGDSCRLLAQTKLVNHTYQTPASGGLLAWQLNSSDSATPYQLLLMAPTMVGAGSGYEDAQDDDRSGERQVTVNEGDNIQLSCQAHGLPPPEFQWRRSQPGYTIMIDISLDLRITSYPEAQLPLLNVDRLHSGGYECLATNGVPPSASKRLHLNVNYAPTVRLYPSPSVLHLTQLGASLLIECLIEANPAPFAYWMFNSQPIMSVPSSDSSMTDLATSRNLGKKYVITESTGQLATGAHYSILTLNISGAELEDLGDYKCVSKNLIGQTTGHFLLLPPPDSRRPIDSINANEVAKLKEMILERNKSDGSLIRASRLDLTLGWPGRLAFAAHYSTFGNEHRPKIEPRPAGRLLTYKELSSEGLAAAKAKATGDKAQLDDLIVNTPRPATGDVSAVANNDNSTLVQVNNTMNYNRGDDRFADVHSSNGQQKSTPASSGRLREDDGDNSAPWSCRVEKPDPKHQLTSNNPKNLARAAQETLLLDQVGKPVYLGSLPASDLLNWWSLVANPDSNAVQAKVYTSSARNPSELFEYDTIGDLLAYLSWRNEKNQSATEAPLDGSQPPRRSSYKLKHHMIGNSHVVSNDGTIFCYVSSHLSLSQLSLQQSQSRPSPEQQSQQQRQQHAEKLSLMDLFIVMLNLNSGEYRYLKLDTRLAANLDRQPFDLGADYQMERLELVTDENGLWLLVPTIDWLGGSSGPLPSRSDSYKTIAETPEQTGAISDSNQSASVEPTRRLQVLQLAWRQNETLIGVDYQVSLKLDWRKLGQVFIIDGILYGIRDRHLYTSKLEFAYDLYGCRLLSSDYLHEPQRTFTNHFGNTQMIKYGPNEPRRLYTIDSGNLLWCPVKLVKIKSSEI